MRLHGINDHIENNYVYSDVKKIYTNKFQQKFEAIKVTMQESPLNCRDIENALLLFKNYQYNFTPFKELNIEATSLQT